jgi:hypothetical protein
VVLYHRGQVNREPQRVVNAPSRRVFVIHKPCCRRSCLVT